MKPLAEYYPEFPEDINELKGSLVDLHKEIEEILKENPDDENEALLLELVKNLQADLSDVKEVSKLSNTQYARIFAGMSAIEALVEVFSEHEEWDVEEGFEDDDACEVEREDKAEEPKGDNHSRGNGGCCGGQDKKH